MFSQHTLFHEHLVHISYTQKPPLIAYAHVFSLARGLGLNIGPSLHLHPYFVKKQRRLWRELYDIHCPAIQE